MATVPEFTLSMGEEGPRHDSSLRLNHCNRPNNVLLAVVKNSRDLKQILKNRVYRIPVAQAPKRKAAYIAFYLPATAKENLGLVKISPKDFDGLIRYYAKIKSQTITPRLKIVTDEPEHPRARESYHLLRLGKIQKLKYPICNKRKMRVVFGFTTLVKLRQRREIKELFDIPPLEEIVENLLKEMEAPYQRECSVRCLNSKRYRLDFAIAANNRLIGIECDGLRSHAGAEQKKKDRQKDIELELMGWKIVRLLEGEILNDLKGCRKKIEETLS